MRALLFDFGGTLDSDGLTWGDRFFPLYREAGLDVPRERWNKAFYQSDDCLPTRFSLKGLSLEKTVRLQVDCVLEHLGPDHKQLAQVIAGRFLEDCRRHFSRNRPVLERLKRRFKLGIVSNWYGNLEGALDPEGLGGLFEVVADSTVVGHIKPAPEIFLFAARRLGVEPQDCLMVGDSVPRDMRGAEGLGMRHALIGPSAAPCCPQALLLKTLPELEGLVS
jgi:HAD superfamily hydrolase (TIGR01509 family)